MIFLESDSHYFHSKIIEYCNRPFKTAEKMNNTLIECHNSVVSKEDEVYHLGDFSFGNLDQTKQILKKLNGKHHLIIGNHDKFSWKEYIDIGFSSVQRFMYLSLPNIGCVGLSHDPAIATIDQTIPWITGHIHNLYDCCNNTINVGVDVRDFTPISTQQLEQCIKQIKITIKHNLIAVAKAKQEIFGE